MPPTRTTRQSRRLVIHAGQIKTGSTSIQTALARGDLVVPGHTWAYPRLPGFLDHVSLDPILRRAFREGKRRDRWVIDALSNLLALTRAETVILSAEHFANLPPDVLAKAVDRARRTFGTCEIVVYIRPHLGALTSLFVELIKQGSTQSTFDAFAADAHRQFIYVRKYTGWKKNLSPSVKVTLRPFVPSALIGGSTVTDFAATVFPGQDAQVDGGASDRKNAALGVRDLMRLKVWHRKFKAIGFDGSNQIAWPLADVVARGGADGGPKLRMHRTLADRMAEVYAKDAARFDAAWFGGTPYLAEALEREREAAIDAPMSVEPEDWLNPDEIAMLEAMAQMFAEAQSRHSLWPARLRHAHVKRQMRDA